MYFISNLIKVYCSTSLITFTCRYHTLLPAIETTDAIGNTENKQVKRNMSKYFQRMFMLISLSLGCLFYDTYSYFFVNKCCIDHLLCMVDVFRLSGTTDKAIIDDRRQDMNGNLEQILISI